jgi:hypothetical protein
MPLVPAAYARIGQLHAVAGHAEMNLLLVTMRRPAAAANRVILLELQRLSFRQRLDVRRGEPKDADRAGDILNRLLAEIGEGERELVSNLIIRRA